MALFKECSWDVHEDTDRLVQGLFVQSEIKFKKKKKKLKRADRNSNSTITDCINESPKNKKTNEFLSSNIKKKSKIHRENATTSAQQRTVDTIDSGSDNLSKLSKKERKRQKKRNKREANPLNLVMVPDNQSPSANSKNKHERNRDRSEVSQAFIAERASSPRCVLFEKEIQKINEQKQAEKSKSLTKSKKRRDKSLDHKTVDSGRFDSEKNTGAVNLKCEFSRLGTNCGTESGNQGVFRANQSDAPEYEKSTIQHKCDSQKKRKRKKTEISDDNENMREISIKKKRKKDSLQSSTEDSFMQETKLGSVEQTKSKSENTEDTLSPKNKKQKPNLRQLFSSDDLSTNQKLSVQKQNSCHSGGNPEKVVNKDNHGETRPINRKHGFDATQESPPKKPEENMSNFKKKKKGKITDSGFSETPMSSSVHHKSHTKKMKTQMPLESERTSFADKITRSPNKTGYNKVPFSIQKLKSVLASPGQSFQQTQKKKLKHTTVVNLKDEKTKKKYKMDSNNPPDQIVHIKCKDGSHGDQGSLNQRMQERLQAARFRYLNEKLYTSTGSEAQDMFTEDETAFMAYHQGYQTQIAKWPVNPVQKMINYIRMRPKTWVVADFGCGDAAIARTVRQTVHSFDLVALNGHVTACDMSKVPLKDNSVDIAVFCLSLMGTNLVDFLCEANRVLKKGGILLVAEVVSRLEKIGKFIHKVQKMGFQALSKDTSNKMFVWIEFNKTGRPEPGRIPKIELMPCVYKRR